MNFIDWLTWIRVIVLFGLIGAWENILLILHSLKTNISIGICNDTQTVSKRKGSQNQFIYKYIKIYYM